MTESYKIENDLGFVTLKKTSSIIIRGKKQSHFTTMVILDEDMPNVIEELTKCLSKDL